jgi:HEAT repeat protein
MRFRFAAIALIWMLTAAAALAQEPQFLGRTRQQWVERLDTGVRGQRTYAAWAISQLALQEAGPKNAMLWLNELCLLAENGSYSVRYYGATGIGALLQKLEPSHPARATAMAALADLLRDVSPGVRLAAAEGLALAGQTKRALPVLVEGMSHPQDAIRIQAVAALEKIGEQARPAEATLQKATTDSSEYVKRISTRALAKLSSPAK